MVQPSVSLVMIVKDEEEMLPRCLSSVKEFVDEIVVVDTGSTDSTPEIARSFGAKVYFHPWEDNFSKHRNQSISYATGDWFLVMDADEEILPKTGHLIRKAIREVDFDSIMFYVISLYAGGRKAFHTQQRLFKNHQGIHYEGRIHNKIIGVKSTCIYPIHILHHGYNVSQEKARSKHERRIRILNKELESSPENPRIYHYLSAAYMAVPDYGESLDKALKALDLAEKAGKISDPFFAWTFYIAVNSLCELNRQEEAKRICKKGLVLFPDDPDLNFLLNRIFFETRRFKELRMAGKSYLSLYSSLRDLKRIQKPIHWVTFDLSWKVPWFLAMSLSESTDARQRNSLLKQAAQMAGNWGDIYHETARYKMAQGRYLSAEKDLVKALERKPNDLGIIYSLLEVYIHLGDEVKEIETWEKLLLLSHESRQRAPQEIRRALSQGRTNDAQKLLLALVRACPIHGSVPEVMAEYLEHSSDILDHNEVWQAAIETNNRIKRAILDKGFYFLSSGNLEKSRQIFRKIITADPSEPAARLGMAVALWIDGDVESMAKELDKLLDIMNSPIDKEITSLEELGTLFATIAELFYEHGHKKAATFASQLAAKLSCSTNSPHIP